MKKIILYVIEVKKKNGWKNVVRFESKAFHDLSQMRKCSKTISHKVTYFPVI